MTPLDEYLEMRPKTAGIGQSLMSGLRQTGRQAGNSAIDAGGTALGAGAVGLAVTGAGVAAAKVYRAITKANDFRQMLEHNPDLTQYQESNPALFNAHYNSLRSLNPGYAQDPIVSGSLMRQMSMSPNTAGKVLMESMESRSKTGPGLNVGLGDHKLSLHA